MKPIELCFSGAENTLCVCGMYEVTKKHTGQVGKSYESDIEKCIYNDVHVNINDTESLLNFHDAVSELYYKKKR